MNGSMSSLTATITSALALKAFTFCELREKLLALIDDEMATYLTSPDMDNIESSFNTRSNVSLSASASSSSTLRDGATRGAATRWLPNSRNVSMWVIMLKANGDELALANDFDDLQSMLQEAVERQRSRLNHALGATSAAASLTPGFHHYPLVPTPAFAMTVTDHKYQSCTSRYHLSSSSEEDAGGSDDETQRFNNFDFTRRFYREFGRQEERAEIYADDSDDDEEMQMLKKTWSAMLESETHERKLYHSGSHFAMLESARHSPTETWARRIEIAGIHNAVKSNATLSATCPVSTQKAPEPATHRAEQLLSRHRSHQQLPVQHFPTCA
ncbi:hypothetical protein PHYSODRAFT_342466 [Phytophthora sojae]|uniref:Uncharacterized protein n=1 Tax=Phytophthora sojae (strain P6497) TaxID=1094619 RepID=G5AGM8_PHYSP|nr:hypothetical protein PHYSODRAFT_323820 [Phytophthora sojae]XP_009539229.1 hypothetical protein PHYSODRAFT_342466 [Phytophthora sojae]EGZ05308.1 hypothetical protein PHYSODRAFT_342466 [Phytophthora sojae]EGZ30444.1 hypothetical protein PHYSODRAFT_323820 [Phytophthora sojae]|eukprot:XP_009517719.1 hypothetical protein PHYSODRAFT_323820 [Phytophthora sojae]